MPEAIQTIPQLYALMQETAAARRGAVKALLAGRRPSKAAVQVLERARAALAGAPRRQGRAELSHRGRPLPVDLSYETQELDKDLLYLGEGEEMLLDFLAQRHQGFAAELAAGRKLSTALSSGEGKLRTFVSDRDGTLNNYCGRYDSSVQSIYNAVFLTRFARRRCRRSVILSSAPLGAGGPAGRRRGGLLQVSVAPPGAFVLAGSKGREALDERGRLHRLPVPERQRRLLEALNRRLIQLLRRPDLELFSLIGSGLQLKFGQTTVAYQDLYGSVSAAESGRLRQEVLSLVREMDPPAEVFRVEDTGRDLEIMLTVQSSGAEGGAIKDFDKGDGVRFLDQALGLGLAEGPTLVCGDTPSDLPMLRAAHSDEQTWSVFVTRDEELKRAARQACSRALFVSEPDVLVALLGRLAQEAQA
jgi:hypothetical protein